MIVMTADQMKLVDVDELKVNIYGRSQYEIVGTKYLHRQTGCTSDTQVALFDTKEQALAALAAFAKHVSGGYYHIQNMGQQ